MTIATSSIELIDDDIDTYEPNAETLAACKELNEGNGIRFTSIDELFKYLKS
jgi:hypothetical protein